MVSGCMCIAATFPVARPRTSAGDEPAQPAAQPDNTGAGLRTIRLLLVPAVLARESGILLVVALGL